MTDETIAELRRALLDSANTWWAMSHYDPTTNVTKCGAGPFHGDSNKDALTFLKGDRRVFGDVMNILHHHLESTRKKNLMISLADSPTAIAEDIQQEFNCWVQEEVARRTASWDVEEFMYKFAGYDEALDHDSAWEIVTDKRNDIHDIIELVKGLEVIGVDGNGWDGNSEEGAPVASMIHVSEWKSEGEIAQAIERWFVIPGSDKEVNRE